jgi:hypothetical protein
VRGTLFTVQKALPLLKDGGSIILNGSVGFTTTSDNLGIHGLFGRNVDGEKEREQEP